MAEGRKREIRTRVRVVDMMPAAKPEPAFAKWEPFPHMVEPELLR